MDQENESSMRNKRRRTRKRKSQKNRKPNVDKINLSVPNKAVYPDQIRILKQRHECIEIMGFTRHPAYEREYNENRKKKKSAKEEKCNIMI